MVAAFLNKCVSFCVSKHERYNRERKLNHQIMLLNVAKEWSGPYSSPNSRFASSFASSNSCRKCIGVPCLRNEYNNDKNTNDNDELKQQLLIQLPNSQQIDNVRCKTTVQTRTQQKIETDERPKQKCFHAAAPCQARGQRLQGKNGLFFECAFPYYMFVPSLSW